MKDVKHDNVYGKHRYRIKKSEKKNILNIHIFYI